ncbi:MAG TPA: hypothetical protein VKU00_14960 [Chthonomonadaceae bacterium]|nr:hypothetical protein [Chthonomonadaceae bacterium]
MSIHERVTAEDIELAERYAAALEKIQTLSDVIPTEDDLERAERYVAAEGL